MGGVEASERILWSSVAYASAFAVGLGLFAWMARRRGLATTGLWLILQAAVAGGLTAAVLTQAVFGGTPGRTILGAVAGGYVAVVVAKRRLGIRRPTGDLFAVALAGGEAVGRIGCFIGGCCYGKEAADLAWATVDHGALRHPTQLYSALVAAAICALLLWLDRYDLPENALFFTQGLLFCAARFGIEFYRVGTVTPLGLTLAQLACLGGMAFFGWKLAALLGVARRPRAAATAR